VLEFDTLAPEFNQQSPLTVYCAVRSPSSDFDAMVYPAGLIQFYGNPFEESLAESADGSLEQVLLFSDCGSNPKVLDDWRREAKRAGAEVIRQGLTANQGFLHSETVEWVLACTRICGDLKTDFIDQDKFDASKGLVTTLQNAWVESGKVFRKLAERESSAVDAPKDHVSVDRQGEQHKESSVPELALKALLDGGMAGVVSQAIKVPAKQRHSQAMMTMLEEDSKYYAWTLEDWQLNLKAARKTVLETAAWTHIQQWREENKRLLPKG
jgi:hypothetical protein